MFPSPCSRVGGKQVSRVKGTESPRVLISLSLRVKGKQIKLYIHGNFSPFLSCSISLDADHPFAVREKREDSALKGRVQLA